jgi:hypothetical protein
MVKKLALRGYSIHIWAKKSQAKLGEWNMEENNLAATRSTVYFWHVHYVTLANRNSLRLLYLAIIGVQHLWVWFNLHGNLLFTGQGSKVEGKTVFNVALHKATQHSSIYSLKDVATMHLRMTKSISSCQRKMHIQPDLIGHRRQHYYLTLVYYGKACYKALSFMNREAGILDPLAFDDISSCLQHFVSL